SSPGSASVAGGPVGGSSAGGADASGSLAGSGASASGALASGPSASGSRVVASPSCGSVTTPTRVNAAAPRPTSSSEPTACAVTTERNGGRRPAGALTRASAGVQADATGGALPLPLGPEPPETLHQHRVVCQRRRVVDDAVEQLVVPG